MSTHDARPAHRPQGWFKAPASTALGACLEARVEPDRVWVRDSKYQGNEDGRPIIRVQPDAWSSFLNELKGGLMPANGELVATPDPDGSIALSAPTQGIELWFTAAEWGAFLDGVSAGEFDLARREPTVG